MSALKKDPTASAPTPTPAQVLELAARLEKTAPAHIVQSIRAYHPPELLALAQHWQHHFLYADLAEATTKPHILQALGQQLLLPGTFKRSFDALRDALTHRIHQAGPQPGFIVVLEHIPISLQFDKEMREQLLDVFRDAADFWAEHHTPFRCFYSFF